MNNGRLRMETEIIFLAMFWGGGPYTIPEIIGVYDWINRAIPRRIEMQTALNTLLAMGLVEQREDKFLIPKAQFRAFDIFKKRKRKNKFDLVTLYFKQLPEISKPDTIAELTEDEYKAHYRSYKKAFEEAPKKS